MLVWEIVALVAGLTSIGVGAYLYKWVISQEVGNPDIEAYSLMVQEGSAAYLKRLFQVLGGLSVVLKIGRAHV